MEGSGSVAAPSPSVASTHASGSVAPAAASPDEPQPCRECRRRRVRCDGALPVCSVCQKYRRHCLYDKHSRTRLTRKQLTILEERLEKAEALLRSHFSQEQLSEMMNGTAPAPAPPPPRVGPSPQSNAATTSSSSPMAPPGSSLSLNPLQPVLGIGTAGGELDVGGSMVAPSVADDFEWNEQESSWANTYGSGIDAAVAGIGGAGGGSADSPQAIMDGMASLSVGERRGYLGAMSGAALLRQILTARRQNEERNEVGGGGGAGTGGGGSGGQGTDEHFETLFQQPPDHSHQHWYRAQSMLTRVAVESLIDAFFTLYHPTFPIVHEPTFRAQYAGTLPRSPDKDRWNTLANIVAALGSFSSSNCTDATDLLIFQAAQKSLFADNLEVGNLTLVQGFGLSATYLQKRNKPNTGYNYGGIALRMAIGLGLHKEFEEGYISPLQMEIRRRVWWTLCILDVGATITYGRPLNWPQSGVEAALPRNIHEEDLVSDSAPYPPEVDGISRYTYLRVQSSYHLKTMCIYNRLIMPPFPRAAELIALDDEHIGSWLAQIPPYYSAYPPAGSLYALGIGITKWRYRNLRIVMYRPFLVKWALTSAPYPYDQQSLGTNSEAMAVFRCLDAAKETIFLIEEYWTSRSHSRLTAWYVLYFLFHATLIPVHCLRNNPQHALASDWRAQIRSSLAVMDAMQDLTPNSGKCREVTLKLCWPHLHEHEGGVQQSQLYGDDNSNNSNNNNDQARAAAAAAAAAAAPPGTGPNNGGSASFVPSIGDGEAASMMDGYDAWCWMMQDTTNSGAVPHLYQWPNVEDQDMNIFYGAASGPYYPGLGGNQQME